MRSYGVADNFQFAVYDPNWRPLSPRDKPEGPGKSFDRRPRTCANKMESSCQLEENLSPRVMYTKTRRRYERDPDNVINPECDATLQPAIADKEKQHHRILKEIKKSQPVRPASKYINSETMDQLGELLAFFFLILSHCSSTQIVDTEGETAGTT